MMRTCTTPLQHIINPSFTSKTFINSVMTASLEIYQIAWLFERSPLLFFGIDAGSLLKTFRREKQGSTVLTQRKQLSPFLDCRRLCSAREKQIGRKGKVPRPARSACCLGSHFGHKSRTYERTAKRACFWCHLLKQLSLKDTGHQTEEPHAERVTLWLPNCWCH